MALGCANGDDIAVLAHVVDRYIAIEPASEWWTDIIGGKPAEYRAPLPSGIIDLPDKSVDLAISFGVLHHIPNVSKVIAEISRVLKPGGLFLLREPISSMGDWNLPRVGLTANERGIHPSWLNRSLERYGLKVSRRRYCLVSPFLRVMEKLGAAHAMEKQWVVQADALLSKLLSKNYHYFRDRSWKKIAPGSIAVIAQKSL